MHQIAAGLVAGGIAVTAGGGVTIVAEGWPQAVLVALAVGAAFGLGIWSADRRIAAVVAVVRSFCAEVAVYYRGPRGRGDHGRGGAGDRRPRRPVRRGPRGPGRRALPAGAAAMIVIAARDAAPADRAGADIVCDGKTDVAVLAKALAVPDREVVLVGRDVRRERRVHVGRQPLPPAGRGRDRPRGRPGPDPARGRRASRAGSRSTRPA